LQRRNLVCEPGSPWNCVYPPGGDNRLPPEGSSQQTVVETTPYEEAPLPSEGQSAKSDEDDDRSKLTVDSKSDSKNVEGVPAPLPFPVEDDQPTIGPESDSGQAPLKVILPSPEGVQDVVPAYVGTVLSVKDVKPQLDSVIIRGLDNIVPKTTVEPVWGGSYTVTTTKPQIITILRLEQEKL